MRVLRAFGALTSLVALLAGSPLALATWGGDLSAISELDQTWVSDRGIFAILTLVLWLLWVFFVASVVAEVVATFRGVPTPRILLARPIQRIAAGLVGALLLTGSAAQGSAVDHLPRRPAPAVEAVVTEHHALAPTHVGTFHEPAALPSDAVDAAPTPAESSVVVVRRGDTAWGIAEAHLGDGRRWRDLWIVNQGAVQPDGRRWTDPQVIAAGWRLVLPGAPTGASGGSHVVAVGESLSSIAASRLGDEGRASELFVLNRGRPQPDGDTLSDADLIRPGWTLQMPASAAPPVTPPPPPPPPLRPLDPSPAPGPHPPAAPDETPVPSTTTTPQPDSGDVGVATADPSWPNLAAWLTSGGALVLATAVALRVRRRWRRQASRRPAASSAAPPSEQQLALVAAADVPLVRWAGQALARLTDALNPASVTGGPVLVELSEDAGIELLWDSPQHGPPTPWAEADEGWTWRLPYDPEAAVPADALPAAMPALVTIGHRHDRQLLLDLEAFGTIGVDGPPDLVDQWLRAVAVELAAGEDLSDADVVLVGDAPGGDLGCLGSGEGRRDAGAEIKRWLERSSESLVGGGWSDTFVARVAAPAPGETGVLVLMGTDEIDLGGLSVPRRRGAAAVGRGLDEPAARITIRADGSSRLDPLGVEFLASGLPPDVATALAQAAVEDQDADDVEPMPSEAAVDIVRSAADGESEAPIEPGPEPEPDDVEPQLVVQVLGAPSVPERPGLGRREVIITTFLACRGGPVAASAVQDAVWCGRAIETKTLWNVIGRTRRALGDLPDGGAVMPSADRAHGTLALASGVVTDLALLRHAVREAEHSSSARARDLLQEALGMVRGQPFDGAGYDWAFRDQLVHEAGVLIESAAEQLVDLALEQGDLDAAREATAQGLRGLPGNEMLYRLRMRAEHAAGNIAGVKAAYDELALHLADFDAEPAEETQALHAEFVSTKREPSATS